MPRGKDLLFFGTSSRLVAIDPAEMRIAVKNGKVPPIPARKSVYYLDAGLPHSAGFAVQGSNLYMMGGHWMRKETIEDPMIVDSKSTINSIVYVADLTAKSIKLHFSPICRMHASKNKPKVLEIKGKLYVLSNFDNFDDYYFPKSYHSPAFEAYDPKTNTVEALPDPPFFDDDDVDFGDVVVNKWFAVGDKIYVMADTLFYRYKVKTKRWRMSITHAWAIESIRRGFLVPGYHDVLINFHESGVLIAKLIIPGNVVWMVQELTAELGLEEANSAIIQGNVYLRWDKATFVEMGKFKVGAVVPGGDMDDNLVVFVFTFVVSKFYIPRPREMDSFPDSETKFLSVICLSKGIYNVGPRQGFKEDAIVNAFFVKGV